MLCVNCCFRKESKSRRRVRAIKLGTLTSSLCTPMLRRFVSSALYFKKKNEKRKTKNKPRIRTETYQLMTPQVLRISKDIRSAALSPTTSMTYIKCKMSFLTQQNHLLPDDASRQELYSSKVTEQTHHIRPSPVSDALHPPFHSFHALTFLEIQRLRPEFPCQLQPLRHGIHREKMLWLVI